MNELTRIAFWASKPARTVRRGHLWVAGDRMDCDGQTYQRGPLFAEWEASVEPNQPFPIVLVHGGGYQGTEWLDTPDGRPGWQQRLVEAGYVTVTIDRPGQGRSPYHVDTLGPMGPPFSYENGKRIYTPNGLADRHTQWPFDRDDEAAWDEFIAGYGPLPADLVLSQEMEAEAIARLLDRIGPAILLTHSASGPVGWLVADKRPGLVKAIVAIEPMGPPFADIPNIGSLEWGLTAPKLTYDPVPSSPEELREAAPDRFQLPALAGLKIVAVIAEASAFSVASPPIVAHLAAAGASAELLQLADYGIHGNGHGLIYEKNSDAALQPILDWLALNERRQRCRRHRMKIGFIGLGAMGSAMARNIARAGHEVRAWNRSGGEVEGVEILNSPADAFDAEIVFTMLSDDAAVRAVILDAGVLKQASTSAVHVVTATISVAFAAELVERHRQAGIAYVSAPVLGRPDVAAKGELNILAAGEGAVVDRITPVLDVLAKQVWRLGDDPVQANAAKIACNMMITMAIEAMAEAVVISEASGLGRERFLEMALGTLFGGRAYQNYSANIIAERYEAGFKASLGLKDLRLATEAAAQANRTLPMLAAVRGVMTTAVDEGKGDQDWSVMADATIRGTD